MVTGYYKHSRIRHVGSLLADISTIGRIQGYWLITNTAGLGSLLVDI